VLVDSCQGTSSNAEAEKDTKHRFKGSTVKLDDEMEDKNL
jgi:hypothetical protein